MADPSRRGRRARVPTLERKKHRGKKALKGGIIVGNKYKSFPVNMRFPRWKTTIWIGKWETRREAHRVVDCLCYYSGQHPLHFPEAVVEYPSITCMGTETGTSQELSTRDMFKIYVGEIAQGKRFEDHRDDFKKQLKEVVARPDFPFSAPRPVGTVNQPNIPVLAPRPEVIVNRPDIPVAAPQSNVAVIDYLEDEAPLEYDEIAASALHMSSHTRFSGVPATAVHTIVAGTDAVLGSESSEVFVPSFDVAVDGSLSSAGHLFDPKYFSPSDCPSSRCEEGIIWMEAIEELNKSSAAVETCNPSFVTDGDEVFQEWLQSF